MGGVVDFFFGVLFGFRIIEYIVGKMPTLHTFPFYQMNVKYSDDLLVINS
jgi:hypothetical protein